MSTLKELIDSPQKIKDLIYIQRCACGNPSEKGYAINNKPSCQDCYYSALGELVEQHPITSPRIHRG